MAINIRNRPNDADAYKVVDLAIAPATETNHGVKYDAATNQTTVNVSTADSKHDFIKIGDYLIPHSLVIASSYPAHRPVIRPQIASESCLT